MKLSWEINDMVISKLYLDDFNIIYPWGIEFADSFSFFSLEEGFGYRYKVIDKTNSYSSKTNDYFLTLALKEGKIALKGTDKLNNKSIDRIIEAEILDTSYLMDFVMRFRFKKEIVKQVIIAGRKLSHNNSNVYYQFSVNKVILMLKNYFIIISLIETITPNKFKLVTYVRDSGNEWVVHFRLIPIIFDKTVIKLCNNWYKTKPLPKPLNKLLLSSNILKKALWYRNERKPYKNRIMRLINPNAYPLVELLKGMKIKLDINCKFLRKKGEISE